MNRRSLLTSIGAGTTLIAGCLGGPDGGSNDGSDDGANDGSQSGSGHPCDDPRNIDYQAVEERHDNGVYLTNGIDETQTACVTVTKEEREREETGSAAPPPLRQTGYEMHPDTAVEIFTFSEAGTYTIGVSMGEYTKTAVFERTESDFGDGTTETVTFEIAGPETISVTRGDGS